jgi:histidinol-phosphate aminotransferase
MSKFWSSIVTRTEPYIPGEQIDDPSIIKLNTNENPYPPSDSVANAIKDELGGNLKRYPSPTVDSLRETIAENYHVGKESIFVGNGSDEILGFSFMAFFEPGKTIRFPNITYSFYPVYAKLFNIPFEEVNVNSDFSLDPSAFFESDGGVIFPNPNAPTGILLSLSAVESIIVQNRNQVVIIDEAYIDFARETAVPLVTKYPNLLVIQTTSKSRSLAGLRVGYAIGHPDLIEGLNRIKNSFNSYTLDRLAIVGASAALHDKSYYDAITLKIIQTRESVSKELTQLGFHVLPSQANFVFASHNKVTAIQLYTLLKQNGILVRHFNKAPIDNYLRITIGSNMEMKLFMERLKHILSKHTHP